MGICTFFGHRDCPDTLRPKLRQTLVDLIADHGVDMFYVGHQGGVGAIVRGVLREMKDAYPQIGYAVVLYRMPGKKSEHDDYSDTMLPEGIESIHPRYAISWRNNWLLWQSDYAVTWVTRPWGGAAQYVRKAVKLRRTVIPLAGEKAVF